MNRRELLCGLGAMMTLGGKWCAGATGNVPPASHAERPSGTEPTLPATVAGVRLVDSAIAKSATELSRNVSPPTLFNHAVRTFLFGSLVGRARGQRFDAEMLYLACVLHDLGLTERYEGALPFEIQGAQAAKGFLEAQQYAAEKIGVIWDGIAFHASAVSQFKQPEIALVGEGAGADVIAPDPSEIKQDEVAQIVAAFPRLGFKKEFVNLCAGVVRKYPQAASGSFMRDVRERYMPEFKPVNFCDRIKEAPYSE